MLLNIESLQFIYLKFSTLDHCGFSWIHLENWLILSVRLSLGVQPRVFRRSPEMAYLNCTDTDSIRFIGIQSCLKQGIVIE